MFAVSERQTENIRLCEVFGFKPPIDPKLFKKMPWRYVGTATDLQPGHRFKTLEELASIPRKFSDPFCHPGPEEVDEVSHWYLVDSIVQEVYLKFDASPYYVVRWRGYEDEYNTVEPLVNVKNTAVYKLFVSPNLYTACRASGCIIRKSQRLKLEEVTVELQMIIEPTKYEFAINKLIAHLRIEEEADRYCPEIGFCSYESVAAALVAQHRFLFDKFLPIVKELESAVHLDKHYIGRICGNLSYAAKFKEMLGWGVTKPNSIKNYISRGLSSSKNATSSKCLPHFVTFFVPRKFGTEEKKDNVHMGLHMAVFTVRSLGNVTDAIYYEPSPYFRDRKLPSTLDDLKKPKLQSFTMKFGVASEKDDCLLQCMTYIIALATGETIFEPDLSQPARKMEKLIAKRAAKRRKIEN